MPELREVFEMTTRQVEPDVDAWREQEGRQRRSARSRKIGALALAAAIGVAAVVVIVALILGTRGGESATTPANEPAPVNPVDPKAVEVATGFLEAYGAFDADRAITYLADDADLSGLLSTGYTDLEGIREFRMMLSFLEAEGYKQILGPCEETGSSASGTFVRCPFDFHAIRSDEIGRGPYGGNFFDLTVRDGEILRASESFEIAKFSPQMWEPFAGWVSRKYPKDDAAMFNADHSDFLLTHKSIRLWELRTKEYVEVVGRRTDAGTPSS